MFKLIPEMLRVINKQVEAADETTASQLAETIEQSMFQHLSNYSNTGERFSDGITGSWLSLICYCLTVNH